MKESNMPSIAKIAICLLITMGSAKATETYCATVKPTPDGFLALRKGPGTAFQLAERLKPQEFLWVGTETCRNGACSNGKWLFIEGVPRLDGPLGQETRNTQGWVSSLYVQPIACPVE